MTGRRAAAVVAAIVLCAAACAWLPVDREGGQQAAASLVGGGGSLRLWEDQQRALLLSGGARASNIHARHAAHARLGLETAYRQDARALRERLSSTALDRAALEHPFGQSRLELGYRDTLDALRHRMLQRHTQVERVARDQHGDAVHRPGATLERTYRAILGTVCAALRDRRGQRESKRGARQQMLVQGPPEQQMMVQDSSAAAAVDPRTLRAASSVLAKLGQELATARRHGVSSQMQHEGQVAMDGLRKQVEHALRGQSRRLVELERQPSRTQDLAQESTVSASPHAGQVEKRTTDWDQGFREMFQPHAEQLQKKPNGDIMMFGEGGKHFGHMFGQHDIVSVVERSALDGNVGTGELGAGNLTTSNSRRNSTYYDIADIVRNAILRSTSDNYSAALNDSELLNRTEIAKEITARINAETSHQSNVLDIVGPNKHAALLTHPKRAFQWIFGRPYVSRGRQHAVANLIFGRRAGDNATVTTAEERNSAVQVMQTTSSIMRNMSLSSNKVRVASHDIDWVFGRTMRDFLADKAPAPANATADAESLKILIEAADNITGLLNESASMVAMAKQSIMHSFVPDRKVDVDHAQHSMMSIFHPLKTTRITIQVDKKGKGKIVDDTAEDDDVERGQREAGASVGGGRRAAMRESAQLARAFAGSTKSMSLSGVHLKQIRHLGKLSHGNTQLAGEDGQNGGEEDGDDVAEEKEGGKDGEGGGVVDGADDAGTNKEDQAIDGWRGLQSFGQWLLIALSLILVIMCCLVLGFICFGCLWAWREFKRQDRWDILFNKVHAASGGGKAKPTPKGSGGGAGGGAGGGGGGGGGGKSGGGGINRRSDTQMAR